MPVVKTKHTRKCFVAVNAATHYQVIHHVAISYHRAIQAILKF